MLLVLLVRLGAGDRVVPSLPVLQRRTLPGYKPWLAALPSVGGVTPLLLTWRPHGTSGGLGIRRANYSNGRVSTWSAPRLLTPSESEVGGEWAIFSLSDGTVLLLTGMGGMVRDGRYGS